MLSLPLSFFIACVLGILLLREWRKEGDWTLSQQLFAWLVGVCIVQSLLVGMVWTYGFGGLKPIMPVTASMLNSWTAAVSLDRRVRTSPSGRRS